MIVNDTYKTISSQAEGIYTEKRSKFIAIAIPVRSLEEIKETIRQRDEIDKAKAEGALKIAADATYIDTSDLTIEQVCEIIIRKIHN